MLVKEGEINDILDRLAQRFESGVQTVNGSPDYRGWGQFLDAPKLHNQVGPYGTSAGLIVLTLAGRGASILTQQARSLLENWWRNFRETSNSSGYAMRRFIQNPRLAFLNLALRLATASNDDPTTRSDVESSLLNRTLPTGLWGDYWFSERLHDQTPRPFCSAMALLSFSLLRDERQPSNNKLEIVAKQLEEKLKGSRDLPLFHSAAIAAAVLTTPKTVVTRGAITKLTDIALRGPRGLGERAAYFYDYEYIDYPNEKPKFGRDYFFVPTDGLIAIAGLQRGAPPELRFLAEAIVLNLIKNMGENAGAYRPGPGERLSSVDQAWAALLLKLAYRQSFSSDVTERVAYELRRQRADNWLTDTALPVFSMLSVTLGNVILKDASLLSSSLAAIAAVVIGGLYGPRVFRKLLGLVK